MPLHFIITLGFLVYLLLSEVHAAPISLLERDGLSVLSGDQVESFDPYTHFASAAYCDPGLTLNWSCEPACSQLPGFMPVASGGDGAFVQYWFVGYYPAMSSVVVAYQGTDPFKFFPILTDLDYTLTTPNCSLFPGLSSDAQVHQGFLSAYTLSQSSVLDAVTQASSTYGTNKVAIVGHSMGAAIAAIAATSMQLRLSSDYSFKVVGYGQPRVGNQAWVSWIDNNLPDLSRINNKHDPVPTLPEESMGFVGSHGEIHIRNDNSWVNCPGDDNPAVGCTVHDVGNLLTSNMVDHLGPYNGTLLGMCGFP